MTNMNASETDFDRDTWAPYTVKNVDLCPYLEDKGYRALYFFESAEARVYNARGRVLPPLGRWFDSREDAADFINDLDDGWFTN